MSMETSNPKKIKNKRLRQSSCEEYEPIIWKKKKIKELMPKPRFGILGL
jgi:hypothetical protein